jgi:hypothetical protein
MWCSKPVTVYTAVLMLREVGVFVFKHKNREIKGVL